MPNILTALHFRPRKMWLLATNHPRVQAAAQCTKSILTALGIATTIVERVPPYDAAEVERICGAIASQSGPLLFNLTGGTKLMVLGAFSAARSSGMPVAYLDFPARRMHWLAPERAEAEPLNDSVFHDIDVRTYLAAHGVSSSEEPRIRGLARLFGQAEFLASQAAEFHHLSARLRYSHHTGQWCPIASRRASTTAMLRRLLDWGYLEAQSAAQPALVRFSEVGKRFLGGPWLEYFVASRLRGLDLQDVAFRVPLKVEGGGGRIDSELDVAATYQGCLLVVSCKTTSIKSRKDPDAYVDHLDELRALGPLLGGTYCRCALVTSEDLGRRPARRVVERAALYRIPLFDRSCFPALTEHFRRLLGSM